MTTPRLIMNHTISMMLAALAFHLATVGMAHAGDDGGTRSIFSNGIGGRPLSLGGAYVAVSDDASAPMWNPGGLGLLTRREFQFGHTTYYDLDINEQFASIVLPHWRWGSFSLTFRHFGVGGIERRDDRNALLDSDLSDNETEFLLGFGRSIGPAWSVGGAAKLRRQSLAGLDGGGVGLDLGVIVHPLSLLRPNTTRGQRFSVGLSAHNVIKPKIQLAQESVPDPTGIRFGAAYRIPMAGNSMMLTTLDIEKTQDSDARLHGGVEMNVHPLLSLRTGLNDGMFVSGASIRWNEFVFDYTFQHNDVGDVHWVGGSFRFGPSVAESHQASIDAEENRLQARLNAAFESRQATRVQELLAQARGLREQGDCTRALESLTLVMALDPNNETARVLQATCWNELASRLESIGDYTGAAVNYSRAISFVADDVTARSGVDRCRAESDRLAERSEEIRHKLSAALDAFSAGNLTAARDGFKSIMRVVPDDAEATAMHSRTLRAIERRVRSVLAHAERMIEWGQLEGAQAAIADARHLNASATRIQAIETRLTEARDAALSNPGHASATPTTRTQLPANASNSVAPKVLTGDEKREIEHLYKRAVTAMSQSKSEEAIRYLELVWSIDSNFQSVTEHLKREYLARGMEHFADGRFEEAVQYWESALRVDPTDERTRGYLSRAREQATRTREILGKR